MHIVLSGYFGFDNVGDEAILFSMIHALRKIDPQIKLTVLSNQPEKTANTYDVEAVNRWNMKEIIQLIKNSDGLISGGGSLLQDATGWKTIPYYISMMKIAKWHKKPVFIYAQGMGPITGKFNRWLTKQSLNKVDAITLRDEASKKLLEELGVHKVMNIVPDPVTGLDTTGFTNDWIENLDTTRPIIAVSVREWALAKTETSHFKVEIALALDELVRLGNQIVFVPMHGEHDLRASEKTALHMKETSKIAPADASIEEKIALIGRADVLIGMRLHALIFAATTATPFIAISYDPKIDAFAAISEQTLIGHVGTDDWNAQGLITATSDLLENISENKANLSIKIADFKRDTEATAEAAIALFQRK